VLTTPFVFSAKCVELRREAVGNAFHEGSIGDGSSLCPSQQNKQFRWFRMWPPSDRRAMIAATTAKGEQQIAVSGAERFEMLQPRWNQTLPRGAPLARRGCFFSEMKIVSLTQTIHH
jgi:hypothetical protein